MNSQSRPVIALALILLSSFVLVAREIHAQKSANVAVEYRVSCATCRLQLTKLADLELGPAVPLLGGLFSVSRDSKGRIFTTNYNATQVVVFSDAGKYIATLGRPGVGPGEVSGMRPIRDVVIGRGDTLFVATARAIVVFSPSLTYVRTIALRIAVSGSRVPLADGTFLVAANVSAPDAAGLQFHILSATGERLRSFAGDDGPVTPGKPRSIVLSRVVMSADRRSFWSSHNNRMQHWSTQGELLHDYTLNGVPWFAGHRDFNPLEALRAARAGSTASRRPNPQFELFDREGNVWIEGAVPLPSVATTLNQHQFRRYLEIFDPVGKVVVLSQPMDFGFRRIPDSDLILGITEDVSGVWRFTIYRAEILRG